MWLVQVQLARAALGPRQLAQPGAVSNSSSNSMQQGTRIPCRRSHQPALPQEAPPAPHARQQQQLLTLLVFLLAQQLGAAVKEGLRQELLVPPHARTHSTTKLQLQGLLLTLMPQLSVPQVLLLCQVTGALQRAPHAPAGARQHGQLLRAWRQQLQPDPLALHQQAPLLLSMQLQQQQEVVAVRLQQVMPAQLQLHVPRGVVRSSSLQGVLLVRRGQTKALPHRLQGQQLQGETPHQQ